MSSIKFNARHGLSVGQSAISLADENNNLTPLSINVTNTNNSTGPINNLGRIVATELNVQGPMTLGPGFIPAFDSRPLDDSTTAGANTAFVMAQLTTPTSGVVLPTMNAVASVGSSTRFSRFDHIHPKDTTKANVLNTAMTGMATIDGGILAGATSQPMLTLTQTWNNATTAFTGFKINITETASSALSLLVDFQRNAVTRFGVDVDGAIFQRLTGSNLSRDIVSGSRHVREYQDLVDSLANGLDASYFEWGTTWNAKWGGTSYVKDRSNVNDHSFMSRLTEGYKQQWLFSDGSVAGSAISWVKKIDFDLPASTYTFSGTTVTTNLNVSGTVGTNLNFVNSGFGLQVAGVNLINSTTLGSSVINSSLKTLGVVTAGTWNAGIIPVAYGGTGASSVLGVNGVLDNILPPGEVAGYVLKTSGAGTYTWEPVGSSAVPTGTRINTTRQATTATAGQITFSCGTYVQGSNQLRVYVNGVRQNLTKLTPDYTETSTTSFTLASPCSAGDEVLAEVDAYIQYDNSAAGISFAPTATILSVNAQQAIQEVEGKKANLNQTMYIGTTALTIDRVSSALSLTGVSIDGTAGNASLLSNMAASAGAGVANSIVARDATGHIFTSYLNSIDNAVTTGVTGIMVKVGVDNYLRTGTKAAIEAFLGMSLYAPLASPTFTGTVTASIVSAKSFSGTLFTFATATAILNWDLSLGDAGTVTLNQVGHTLNNPTNLKSGNYILIVKQDATGSRTITTWGTAYKFPGGVKPVLSTAANAIDILSFYCDGTNLYGSYVRGMA